MDSTPFFEFNITEIKETEIAELKKFHKSYFDVESITNTASELKYLNELKNLQHKELISPSETFISFFTKQVYPGVMTAKVKEQFDPIIKRSFNLLISDTINERLKSALNQEKQIEAAEAGKPEGTITTAEPNANIVTPNASCTVTRSLISLSCWMITTGRRSAVCTSEDRKSIWSCWMRRRRS
jgi:hypothetical protein